MNECTECDAYEESWVDLSRGTIPNISGENMRRVETT